MDNLNFNIFNIIIISGVIHGLIFSVFILFQKKLLSDIKYLALAVLFISLSNFQYWILDTKIENQIHLIKYIYVPWHWLVLPMFYFYVYHFLSNKKPKVSKKILLIGPFFTVLLLCILQFVYKILINPSYNISSHFNRGFFVYTEIISVIFNMIVIFYTLKLIINYEKKHKEDNNFKIKSSIKWLKQILYISIFVCICWGIAEVIIIIYNLKKSYVFYPMWISISTLIYWIGYVGVQKSQQLQERIDLRNKRLSNKKITINFQKNAVKTFSKLEHLIITNKLYQNSNITLSFLSQKVNLSEGYISQLINKHTCYNFNDYINNLRIEDAKQMLSNKDFNNYTISSIGLESGFNTKTSFYNAFKKFTGKTPNQYKKSVQNY